MRRLLEPKVMLQGAVGGLVLTVLSLPYLYQVTPHPALFALRTAFLFPVATVLLQTGVAWTPLADAAEAFPRPFPLPRLGPLLLAAAAVAVVRFCCFDERLEQLFPGYLPRSVAEWVVSLPWTVLVQSLILVVGPYAFGVRLAGRPGAGMAAVVLVRQAMVAARYGPGTPAAVLIPVVVGAALYALFLGLVYRRTGYPGLAAVSLVIESRLPWHLL